MVLLVGRGSTHSTRKLVPIDDHKGLPTVLSKDGGLAPTNENESKELVVALEALVLVFLVLQATPTNRK